MNHPCNTIFKTTKSIQFNKICFYFLVSFSSFIFQIMPNIPLVCQKHRCIFLLQVESNVTKIKKNRYYFAPLHLLCTLRTTSRHEYQISRISGKNILFKRPSSILVYITYYSLPTWRMMGYRNKQVANIECNII